MSPAGYVYVDELLRTKSFTHISLDEIYTVVHNNDKQRFGLAEDNGRLMIRANQGHSVKGLKDEKLLKELKRPLTVFHGTNKATLQSIEKRGLCRMTRNHIHFALGLPGAKEVISGARTNCTVFIEIDMAAAMADGVQFFSSDNAVVLTSGVNGFLATKYFKQVLVDMQPFEFRRPPLELDYILVIDLGANATNSGKLPCQEVIEFPVCAVNVRTLRVEQVFHWYVRPEVVPQLTEFIVTLTGITQEVVDAGILMHEALAHFEQFLQQTGISRKNWVFLSCGDWDLRTCLPNELGYKNIARQEYFGYWINIKNFMPQRPKDMMECLEVLNIAHSGRHHSGIDDTNNIAQCVISLLQAGARVFEDDIVSNLNEPSVLPPYKQLREEIETFDALVIVTFECVLVEKKPVIVAARSCLFSLLSNSVVSYHEKLIRPARPMRFDTEKTLMISEQVYKDKATLFSEFENYLKETIELHDLGNCVLACSSDAECKIMLKHSVDKPPYSLFRRWINLYKYFTNSAEDTGDNLKALYSHSGRELPGKAPTHLTADYTLKMLVDYLLSTLSSYPRVFKSTDLTF